MSLLKVLLNFTILQPLFWELTIVLRETAPSTIVVPSSSHIVIFHNIDSSALIISILKGVEVTTFKIVKNQIYLRWNFVLRNLPFLFYYLFICIVVREKSDANMILFLLYGSSSFWNIYLGGISF